MVRVEFEKVQPLHLDSNKAISFQYLFNIFPISFQYLFNIFSISFQSLFNIFSIFFQSLFNLFSISFQYLFSLFSILLLINFFFFFFFTNFPFIHANLSLESILPLGEVRELLLLAISLDKLLGLGHGPPQGPGLLGPVKKVRSAMG